MSGVACICGRTLSDSTDFLFYKAHVIPDMDTDDFYAEAKRTHAGNSGDYTFTLYQCPDCGRLILSRPGHQQWQYFLPEYEDTPKRVLASTMGDNYRRILYARFTEQSKDMLDRGFRNGYVECYGINEQGYESFDTWEETEKRYFELFELYQQADRLRGAWLKKGSEIVHDWTPEPTPPDEEEEDWAE